MNRRLLAAALPLLAVLALCGPAASANSFTGKVVGVAEVPITTKGQVMTDPEKILIGGGIGFVSGLLILVIREIWASCQDKKKENKRRKDFQEEIVKELLHNWFIIKRNNSSLAIENHVLKDKISQIDPLERPSQDVFQALRFNKPEGLFPDTPTCTLYHHLMNNISLYNVKIDSRENFRLYNRAAFGFDVTLKGYNESILMTGQTILPQHEQVVSAFVGLVADAGTTPWKNAEKQASAKS